MGIHDIVTSMVCEIEDYYNSQGFKVNNDYSITSVNRHNHKLYKKGFFSRKTLYKCSYFHTKRNVKHYNKLMFDVPAKYYDDIVAIQDKYFLKLINNGIKQIMFSEL